MSVFSTFVWIGGGLLSILILLFVVQGIRAFLKNRGSRVKREKRIIEIVEVRKVISRVDGGKSVGIKDLLRSLIVPVVLVGLLVLLVVFEPFVVKFVGGYGIELSPINYVSLFTIVGLIFITRGAVLGLREEKSKLGAFVWLMHGFVLTISVLIYELINQSHVVLFGMRFSWLVVLPIIWEIVFLGNVFSSYRKI